jgi:hypothetical protein
LGGPGTSGVLIFNKNYIKIWFLIIQEEEQSLGPIRGGTFIDNIEDREDGGTPGFMQVIKIALFDPAGNGY